MTSQTLPRPTINPAAVITLARAVRARRQNPKALKIADYVAADERWIPVVLRGLCAARMACLVLWWLTRFGAAADELTAEHDL